MFENLDSKNEGQLYGKDNLTLSFGEVISKNDFKNNDKVEQIRKMILKIKSELLMEKNIDKRINMIYNGLMNYAGPLVFKWNMEDIDLDTVSEIFNAIQERFPHRSVVGIPNQIDLLLSENQVKEFVKCFDKWKADNGYDNILAEDTDLTNV